MVPHQLPNYLEKVSPDYYLPLTSLATGLSGSVSFPYIGQPPWEEGIFLETDPNTRYWHGSS